LQLSADALMVISIGSGECGCDISVERLCGGTWPACTAIRVGDELGRGVVGQAGEAGVEQVRFTVWCGRPDVEREAFANVGQALQTFPME